MDEKMKDEVKITVIATGFKEVSKGREQAHQTAAGVLGARNAATSTFQVPAMREPEVPRVSTPEPRITERPINASYLPDSVDDYELGSEVVRHAQPVEESPSASYAREAESTYASVAKGAAIPEEPPTIETVTSSVNINYDANDLEIPAFLRKRGEN